MLNIEKCVKQHAKINWSDLNEPFSLDFNDVYFNTDNGDSESIYTFLEANNIPNRWLTHENETFFIAETGFGTGLNFFNTCCAFIEFKKNNKNSKLKKLHFISFEKYPLCRSDFIKTTQRWSQFNEFIADFIEQYPQQFSLTNHLFLDKYDIQLTLYIGDVNDTCQLLHQQSNFKNASSASSLKKTDSQNTIDAWYLDGFAPSKNKSMWQESLFLQMAQLSDKQTTLATFTSAGFVRRALQNAGFNVTKRKGFGKKREMICAIFDNCCFDKK